MKRSFKTLLILSLLLIICLGVIYFFLFHNSQIPFDSQKWKNVTLYLSDNTRYKMYKNLTVKYKLLGMTKEEIIELLGPQSDPSYFKDWDLRYWMGPEPAGIDSAWLVLKLKDNKVVKYSVVTD